MLALHPNDRLELVGFLLLPMIGIRGWSRKDDTWNLEQELKHLYCLIETPSELMNPGLCDANMKRLCDVMPLWLSWSKWRKHVEQRLHSLESDVLRIKYFLCSWVATAGSHVDATHIYPSSAALGHVFPCCA
jgi:hypothetical protein